MDRYYDRLLPLFRQLLLLPNRNNKFMNLQANCSTSCFNQFCRYLFNTWRFVTFQLLDSQLNIRGTCLRYQWFCCVYFCLPNIFNSMHVEQLGEIVPPSSHQVTFLILYYITNRVVPLLKVTDAPIQVPNVLHLTVSFQFLNFSSKICLLFVPEMSANFTAYIVQIIYIALAWILYPQHIIPLPLILKT